MTPEELTSRLVLKVLAARATGLTYTELLRRMLIAAEKNDNPLYLGSGVTLRDYLQKLAERKLILPKRTANGKVVLVPSDVLVKWVASNKTPRTA